MRAKRTLINNFTFFFNSNRWIRINWIEKKKDDNISKFIVQLDEIESLG